MQQSEYNHTRKNSSTKALAINLLSSTGTMSITTMYLASGSKPEMLIWMAGDIFLQGQSYSCSQHA